MARTAARITQADVARAMSNRDTFIYFLRAGEFIKIGHSRNWRSRMADMQTGSPYTIVPLLVIIGQVKEEKKFHSRFRTSHFRGEWLHSSGAITSFIRDNLDRCVVKSGLSDIRTPPEPIEIEEVIL